MWRLSVFSSGTNLWNGRKDRFVPNKVLPGGPRRKKPPKPRPGRARQGCAAAGLPRACRLLYSTLFMNKGPEMTQESEYQAGSMDISQHKKAYEGFVAFVKWSFAGIMLTMIMLAIFRT